MSSAAEAVKINRLTHYNWLRDDPEYPPLFEKAKEAAVDVLVREATRRAVAGVEKLKWHQGTPCMVPLFDSKGRVIRNEKNGEPEMVPYVEHEYSDTLLIFLMKAADPKRFNDRLVVESQQYIEHSGEVGVSAAIEAVQNDPEYLEYLRCKALEEHGVTAADGDNAKSRSVETGKASGRN